MATVLAYSSPAAGHLFPLMPGLLALRDRGHDVHVRTGPDLVGVARAAGLKAEAVDPAILAVPMRDYEAERDVDRLRRGLHDMIARRGPIEVGDLRRAVEQTGAEVLLVDTNAYGAGVAAASSGLPWAITLPSLPPFPGRGIPPYGLGLRPRHDPLGRVRDAVLWRVLVRQYGRAMLPGLNALRAREGLAPLDHPLGHLLSADRVLVLTGEPLEYPRAELPPGVRIVGAQNWDPPADTPAWLDEPGAPWVLVTCSTDYQRDEALAVAAVEALRDEPVRVILTLADAYDGVRLPPAANVRAERFVPHGPVLERAAAVVSHAGMGIVHKAVAAGVPIVAVPFGRDQPEVARRVVEAGAGVRLQARRLTPERLRAAVREAIGMRASAEQAGARLRAGGGGERFADAAEELASMNAPAGVPPAGLTSMSPSGRH